METEKLIATMKSNLWILLTLVVAIIIMLFVFGVFTIPTEIGISQHTITYKP